MVRLMAHGVVLDLEVYVPPGTPWFALPVPSTKRSCAYTVILPGTFYQVDPGIQVAQFRRDEKDQDTYHLINQPRRGWFWAVVNGKLKAVRQ